MHTYNPADDQPPTYEPDYDGEHLHEPEDEMTDADYAAYDAWVATQPKRTVTHACGHTVSYLEAPWLRVSAEAPCGACTPYEDPFGENEL